MGPGHAFSGAAAGFGAAYLAAAYGMPVTTGTALLAAGLGAGAALLPDLDHPSATVARTFGPLTVAVAKGLNAVSSAVYDRTKTRHDDDRDGGHRGLTHTWVFAGVVGGALALAVDLWGKPVVIGALFVLLSLALRGLAADWARRGGWIGVSAIAAGLTWFAGFAVPAEQTGPWLGAVVTLGCLVHCWGDSLTLMGCPWLWPIPIARRTWYPIGPPGFMRFKAGGTAETYLVMPALVLTTVAAGVYAVPGALSFLAGLIT